MSKATVRAKLIVVSVVFRGGLWLDGVAISVGAAKERTLNARVATIIRTSKQFSQLHAVLVSPRIDFTRELSLQELARRVKLPVIAISKPRSRRRKENRPVDDLANFDISVAGKYVAITPEGINREGAENLYRISCNPYGMIPDALRVADILAEEICRT